MFKWLTNNWYIKKYSNKDISHVYNSNGIVLFFMLKFICTTLIKWVILWH